jgi:predicted house-cleaning noncanonical NTP pyrophosphatase (MazG superfamily)
MKKYNKLVRDKVPEILRHKLKSYTGHTADDKEYAKALAAKLVEEALEFQGTPSIDELADVAEVLFAISHLNGWNNPSTFLPSWSKLQEAQHNKRNARGAFNDKYILEEVEE